MTFIHKWSVTETKDSNKSTRQKQKEMTSTLFILSKDKVYKDIEAEI